MDIQTCMYEEQTALCHEYSSGDGTETVGTCAVLTGLWGWAWTAFKVALKFLCLNSLNTIHKWWLWCWRSWHKLLLRKLMSMDRCHPTYHWRPYIRKMWIHASRHVPDGNEGTGKSWMGVVHPKVNWTLSKLTRLLSCCVQSASEFLTSSMLHWW